MLYKKSFLCYFSVKFLLFCKIEPDILASVTNTYFFSIYVLYLDLVVTCRIHRHLYYGVYCEVRLCLLRPFQRRAGLPPRIRGQEDLPAGGQGGVEVVVVLVVVIVVVSIVVV